MERNVDFPDIGDNDEIANIWSGRFNCLEEYTFVDTDSFKFGLNSKSFVHQIPMITTSQKDKQP